MTERELLLHEIDDFLRRTGLSEQYFGQAALKNSKLIGRLRKGGSIQIETAAKIREYIRRRLSETESAA